MQELRRKEIVPETPKKHLRKPSRGGETAAHRKAYG